MDAQKICPGTSTEKSPHLYRTNAEIAGFSRNIYEPWMETGEVDQKIHEKYQRVEAGAYLRVCEILEKSIYGQQNLEPYEMRTVSAFMKKLEVIGDNTLNRRGRIELRYGYVVRIMEKICRKTGQKGKTKKNSRKELTK